MAHAIAKSWSCQGCTRIGGQPRSRVGPHEFLVLRRPGASAVYQCLVCHSNLVCDLDQPVPRWQALAAPTVADATEKAKPAHAVLSAGGHGPGR